MHDAFQTYKYDNNEILKICGAVMTLFHSIIISCLTPWLRSSHSSLKMDTVAYHRKAWEEMFPELKRFN